MSDQDHGEKLAIRFLKMCEDDGATGVALLNAIGNALVGFFMVTKFDNHFDRMKELDAWYATLKTEVTLAVKRKRLEAMT
jgi:hypothetical protein